MHTDKFHTRTHEQRVQINPEIDRDSADVRRGDGRVFDADEEIKWYSAQ